MKKFAIGCGGLFVLLIFFVVVIGLWAVGANNSLVRQSQNVDNKWADVQTDYQRRADLIPSLVGTVQGAANFEKSTLEAVTQARASVGQVKINPTTAPSDAQQLAAFDKAQGQLSSALSRLLVVSERYPELKANNNFVGLQAQLEGTENRIAVARRDFNEAVAAYNTSVQSFPTSFIAGLRHFVIKPYFNAAPGSETAPKVQFNFNDTNAAPAK